jgi:hypothetical protein
VSSAVWLLAIVSAACGSTTPKPAPDPRAQVSQAVYSYLHAQSQGDGATACGLLTASGQNELVTLVVKDGKGLITSRPACPDAVGLVHAFAGAKLLGALASARVAQVRVNGLTASAEVIDGGTFRPQQVRLQRSGAQWKIAAVPGLAG